VWQSIPYAKSSLSVFEQGWVTEHFPSVGVEAWDRLRLLRNDVNRCIEEARRGKQVGASMECRVLLHASDADLAKALREMIRGDAFGGSASGGNSTNAADDLRFVLMVSQVEVVDSEGSVMEQCPDYHSRSSASESGVTVGVALAKGKKCDRCWYYSDTVGHDHTHDDVCLRCAEVLVTDGYVVAAV